MRAQSKNNIRLFKKHIARLITIIAIVIVSVGFMSGIGEVEGKVSIAIENEYKSHNIADLYIKSQNEYGFSPSELEIIENRFKSEQIATFFSYEQKLEDVVTRIYHLDLNENSISRIELLEGAFPKGSNQIAAERETDGYKGYKIGDKIKLQGVEYEVCGIVYNPMLSIKVKEMSFAFENEKLGQVFYLNTDTPPIINDAYVSLSDRELFGSFSQDYKQVIEDLRAEVSQLLGDSAAVLTLYENMGIYSLNEYADKVGMIGIIFVIFFLLVTLLIVYSAMNRLFDEERGKIACLKTLGYSNLNIVKGYLLFVLTGTLAGGILGYFVGLGLTRVIYVAFGIQYEMPEFPAETTLYYYLITFGIVVIATLLLTLLTGLSVAKKRPVDLLVKKAGKSGGRSLLEKAPFIWNALSFKYKSTFRNVFLFKSRFLMTVTSVIGGSVLIFAGLGLMDCARGMENAKSLVFVSIALIIFSAALCALTIYNLTNINVSERTREIATLMVLGYDDREVEGYIFREVYIMSLIGAVLGIPVGMVFVHFVFAQISFGSLGQISWVSYVLAPLITMIFSALSTLMLKKKIVNTDMNASLKTLE